MLDSLKGIFTRLIATQQTAKYRYLYDTVSLQDRLIGVVGPRGVGKTTLLLQLIKNKFPAQQGVFYFSADHIYFNSNTLYQFVETLYLDEAITTFFIDEIHKYPNWNQELKNLYDGFPKIKIVFSGSSSLDLVQGSHDLSRRARLYFLPGLSFREYLNFKTDTHYQPIRFEDLINDPMLFNDLVPSIARVKSEFQYYLQKGYYPFFLEEEQSIHERILRVVDKTIYEDIANFYKLKTQNLPIFKKILHYFSSVEPGVFSHHNLAKNLGIDDKTAAHYLFILASTGLTRAVFPEAKGNQILRKPEKMFLNNTTLSTAIHSALGEKQSLSYMRELFFLQSMDNAGIAMVYSSIGDYQTRQCIFEIGGKNKTSKQLKGETKLSYLVKDDIFFATKKEIPLYLFGFLY